MGWWAFIVGYPPSGTGWSERVENARGEFPQRATRFPALKPGA